MSMDLTCFKPVLCFFSKGKKYKKIYIEFSLLIILSKQREETVWKKCFSSFWERKK